MEKKEFTYLDSKSQEHTIDIDPEDFKFTQEDKNLHDEKMLSKPTTFLKDAMRRFVKNKSSVVGAIILGILVLAAFIVPAAVPYNIDTVHPEEVKLMPKIHEAGDGFWDGTKKYTKIAYDRVNNVPGGGVNMDAVLKDTLTVSKEGDYFIDTVNAYAWGGYMCLNSAAVKADDGGSYTYTPADFYSYKHFYKFSATHYSVSFTIGDLSQYPSTFNNEAMGNGAQSEYKVAFRYLDFSDNVHYFTLKDYSTDKGTFTVDMNAAYAAAGVTDYTEKAQGGAICFLLKTNKDYEANLLIKDVKISSTDATDDEKTELANISTTDANATLSINPSTSGAKYYWTPENGRANLHQANILYCSYLFDTYKNAYGDVSEEVTDAQIRDYMEKGYFTMDYDKFVALEAPTEADKQALIDSFVLLDEAHSPVRSLDSISSVTGGGITASTFTCTVSKYRRMGYTTMPMYLFGTGEDGNDLVAVTFAGLRTSLILGILTSLVCFVFGLCWGAITGYFGGWTDIIMERFTDILSGLPWIVIMTFAIIKFGSSFLTFAMALCLTGWIGTSSITRTQFYRYKDREYILAARTLGASDFRLIFKHILPNAVGTIITSSVLMIPSVIFSEATISYLGLGLQNLASLGVTLSENQKYIETFPHLIIFPSVIMALIMISFNLFGNGLRDAFNPSLKGNE